MWKLDTKMNIKSGPEVVERHVASKLLDMEFRGGAFYDHGEAMENLFWW